MTAALTQSFAQSADTGLRARLQAALGQDKSEFHEWITREGQFPFVSYAPAMDEVWQYFRERGYGQSFDYVGWLKNFRAANGDNILEPENRDWVEAADSETLDHIVFVIRRAERFSEGLAASAIKSGLFLSLMERIETMDPALPAPAAPVSQIS